MRSPLHMSRSDAGQQRLSSELQPDLVVELDDDMWLALIGFRARHGRRWKDRLTIKWMNGEDEREPNSAALRRIRNQLGPGWLMGLSKATLNAAARRIDNLAQS